MAMVQEKFAKDLKAYKELVARTVGEVEVLFQTKPQLSSRVSTIMFHALEAAT